MCNENCVDGCTGAGANSCVACKHSKDGSFCVEECPLTKYDDAGECKECHENCFGGCKGPETTVGFNGCNDCKDLIDEYENIIFCVKECPAMKYNENGVCKLCHANCFGGCKGPENTLGVDGCDACKHTKDNYVCVDECPVTKYDNNGECEPCHESCMNGCFGPGPNLCNACNHGTYSDNGNCVPCHENCLSCKGPENVIGPNGCEACKGLVDGAKCVTQCTGTKYENNGECKPCHENCLEGCKGPGNEVGGNGCDECKYKKDGSLCIKQCPDTKYDINGICIGK